MMQEVKQMKQNKYRKYSAVFLSGILMFGTGCSTARAKEENNTAVIEEPVEEVIEVKQTFTPVTATANTTSGGMIDATDLFTDRDLQQNADTSDAVTYTLKDGQTVTLNQEGVYVFTGSASNAQIRVEAADTDKIQIVLDAVQDIGAAMGTDEFPAFLHGSQIPADGLFRYLKQIGQFRDADTFVFFQLFSYDLLSGNRKHCGTSSFGIFRQNQRSTSIFKMQGTHIRNIRVNHELSI